MDTLLTPTVEIRPADQRDTTNFGWLDSKHSFSFGHHQDRNNTHHGLLLVNNDDIVEEAPDSTPTRTATWRSSPGCCKGRWCTRTPPAIPGSSIRGWRSG